MIYCHECGARIKRIAMFCGQCGTPVKKKAIPKQTKDILLFVIFVAALLVSYVALDIYAISRIIPSEPPEISSDYSITFISTVTMKNPTFIPVMCSRITYGDNARTGFVFILPYSKATAKISREINPSYHGMLGPIKVAIGGRQ